MPRSFSRLPLELRIEADSRIRDLPERAMIKIQLRDLSFTNKKVYERMLTKNYNDILDMISQDHARWNPVDAVRIDDSEFKRLQDEAFAPHAKPKANSSHD